MSCYVCEKYINGSIPLRGNIKTCEVCGQKWWCYNGHCCLWSKIYDNLTWENILQDCKYPVSINPEAISGSLVFAIEREKFVKPSSQIRRPLVSFPRYEVVEINGRETPVIQWIGEYDAGNMLSYQFYFPLVCPIIENWDMFLNFIQADYLGTVEGCLDEDLQRQIKKHFKDPNRYVAYIVGTDPEVSWKGKPISFVCEVVLLGDSNVGIIRPQHYPFKKQGENQGRMIYERGRNN